MPGSGRRADSSGTLWYACHCFRMLMTRISSFFLMFNAVTIVTKLENCQILGECCTESMTMAVGGRGQEDGVAPNVVCIRDVVADAGARQKDVFSVDVEETMRAYQHFYENAEDICEREKAWLTEESICVVVSDVVPFALRAAEMAGIPSCCLSNFTWDYIYSSFGEGVRERYSKMLLHLEQELYSRASVYLRLPGACPCLPQLEEVAIDIPMIARTSKVDCREVRERLGLDDAHKVCLVMLGGHRLSGVGSFSVHDIILPDGWICIMTPSIWRDMSEDGSTPVPEHVRVIPDADAYMPDIIECSDVVLGKVGFGTVGECLSSKTPLVYVKRENFAEEENLIRLLESHQSGFEISKETFVSGDWRFVDDVVATLNPIQISAHGARVAAQLITEVSRVYEKVCGTIPCDDTRHLCFGLVAQLNGHESSRDDVSGLFNDKDNIYINRAPGRIDVFGGIADYSWSCALEMPTSEATFVATQFQTTGDVPRDDNILIRILSPSLDTAARSSSFASIPLSDLVTWDEHGMLFLPTSYDFANLRRRLKQNPPESWVAYIVGAFVVLAEKKRAFLPKNVGSIVILVKSTVPEGAGVSSSAALEVASLVSIAAALGICFEKHEVPLLAHRIENFIVGVSCGVMDMTSSYLGMADSLLSLRCSDPVQIFGQIKIPDNLRIWGVYSGVRHRTGSSRYTSVRIGAFMGKKIIQTDGSGPSIQALTDLNPREFEEKYMHLIPDTILGADFLSRYHSHDDPATKINQDVVYEVKHATCHPIYENDRVKRFTEFFRDPQKSNNRLQCELMGELMYESHESYSSCGLGSSETNLLVNLARNIGPSQGIFGAKISGGGCGGTVCILTTNDSRAETSIHRIQQEYQKETGIQTYLFRGSSSGSRTFGTAIVTLQ